MSEHKVEPGRGSWYHPNSAYALADKKQRALARKNRIKFSADRRSIEAWSYAGCQSGIPSDDRPAYKDEGGEN